MKFFQETQLNKKQKKFPSIHKQISNGFTLIVDLFVVR